MGAFSVQIGDSFKNYPKLTNPKERKRISFRIDFLKNLYAEFMVVFDCNVSSVRIVGINMLELPMNAMDVSFHVNTNFSIFENQEAMRIVINFSGNDPDNYGVGSCIIKLTQQGTLVLDSKTERIKKFSVLA
ncbi:MAG TPA: hypothetical protein VKA27_12360 [Sunxiuqinia sp.]|nr:hypothetical protein [Sunxiuqinia sp.]